MSSNRAFEMSKMAGRLQPNPPLSFTLLDVGAQKGYLPHCTGFAPLLHVEAFHCSAHTAPHRVMLHNFKAVRNYSALFYHAILVY